MSAAATLALGGANVGFAQQKSRVAVIGTGRMGAALGARLAKLGHEVVYGSREPASERVRSVVEASGARARAAAQLDAAGSAELVALALVWSATEGFIRAAASQLAGKIVVDITNAPLKFGRRIRPEAVESSAGELIQQWAPKARVVKALNTVGYHIVANPALAKGPVTVPLVGNEPGAKASVAQLCQALGFETCDVGPIENAHALEAMSTIYLVPYLERRFEEAFEFYFRKGTAPPGITPARVRSADTPPPAAR